MDPTRPTYDFLLVGSQFLPFSPLCPSLCSLLFYSVPTFFFLVLISFPFLFDLFQALASVHAGLCMSIQAVPAHRQSRTHTHTSLSLFNHWLYYRSYFFPDNASEADEPGRPNKRGTSLYPSSHECHRTGTPSD